MSASPTERRALRIPEFAAAYGISRSLVFELIQRGELVARKIAGTTVILSEDVDRWLASLPSAKAVPLPDGKRRRGRPRRSEYLPRDAA